MLWHLSSQRVIIIIIYKARQPEGQMPIMLATYSTNKIIVYKTVC